MKDGFLRIADSPAAEYEITGTLGASCAFRHYQNRQTTCFVYLSVSASSWFSIVSDDLHVGYRHIFH